MQELRVHRWCDYCHADSKAFVVAVQSFLVTIANPFAKRKHDAALTRRLDLCEEHATTVCYVRDQAIKWGTKPKIEDESQAAEPAPLPRRPVSAPVLAPATQPALMDSEPATVSDSMECPVAGCGAMIGRPSMRMHLIRIHQAKPPTIPKRCPDCSIRQPLPQIMASHRARFHGHDAIAELAGTVKQ